MDVSTRGEILEDHFKNFRAIMPIEVHVGIISQFYQNVEPYVRGYDLRLRTLYQIFMVQ